MKTDKKLLAIVALFCILTCSFSIYGNKREIPDSLVYLFHNNFYFRYSHGMTFYFKDVQNGYAGFSTKEIRFGRIIEPEIGTFIRNFLQIGISYLYLDGKSEDTVDAINFQGYGYNDIFFSGASIKARYFIVNGKRIKIPVGIECIWGKSRLKSGTTDNLNRKRGMSNHSAFGDYEATGLGGGLSGTFAYYPVWFFSIGIDAGMRILLSQGLKEINEGWELPNYKGGTQTLNFSSMFLKGYLSLQF
jgi:hypothetical protein